MIIFRPIRADDLTSYLELALSAQGFYTLPKEVRLLKERLANSLSSFAKQVHTPSLELYTFVAEDTENEKLMGVSAIAATTGEKEPLYFFRKDAIEQRSTRVEVVKKIPTLNLVSYVRGTSEMCSLFVSPHYRKEGVGRLLSLARFLFIAQFPARFTNSLFAELRGKFDTELKNSFWEGVGRHFFQAPLEKVHEMMQFGRAFLGEFLPTNPIYIPLLPLEVQETIGQVDRATEGALHMLLKQGFSISDEIDVLDGGPKLRANKNEIKAIKDSLLLTVAQIANDMKDAQEYLISNTHLDFRALITSHIHRMGSNVTISREVAKALEVGIGDTIRLYDFKGTP